MTCWDMCILIAMLNAATTTLFSPIGADAVVPGNPYWTVWGLLGCLLIGARNQKISFDSLLAVPP